MFGASEVMILIIFDSVIAFSFLNIYFFLVSNWSLLFYMYSKFSVECYGLQ